MTIIHHTFGPHIDSAYLWRTIGMSFVPWRYRRGKSHEAMRSALQKKFHADAALFASGREALLALLRALEVRPGEEIIIQGYTCIVVPNAIHAAGAVPIFADIDPDTLNLTPATVEPLITHRTRAVICQHTFGIPADTDGLQRLCEQRGITLIEDCAHILPDSKGPASIGKAPFLILSFGRDKAISGITGGAVISKEKNVGIAVRELERTALDLPIMTIVKLLEYPSRMSSLIRPLAGTKLLRMLLWILKRIGFIVPIVTDEEKVGRMSPILHRLPNACAFLALFSLRKLEKINEQRRLLTALLLRHAHTHRWPVIQGAKAHLPLQKLPLFHEHADGIRSELKKRNIFLADGWESCTLCPSSVRLMAGGYTEGMSPIAECVGKQILSLPTHPTMTLFEAEKLAREMNLILAPTEKQ